MNSGSIVCLPNKVVINFESDELDAKVASEFTGNLEIINEEGSVSYTGYEYNYITREIYPERSILRLDFRKKI